MSNKKNGGDIMNKRYQVFVSSTYSDLQEERHEVIETIMQIDCIPAGMELFPASNDEQFEFIKKVIDDCDYYILIIGGRYGSEDFEGISYTEKEYRYAKSKGIPILAFIHGNPENIPFGKAEQDTAKREKLEKFKEEVCKNRLIKYWDYTKQLPGMVALSLIQAIKMYPQQGWVRGGNFDNIELLEQINALRLENEKYKNCIVELKDIMEKEPDSELILSDGAELIELYGVFCKSDSDREYRWSYKLSWDDIFRLWGPFLFVPNTFQSAKANLENVIEKFIGKTNIEYFDIDSNLFQTIKIQYMALGLINIGAESQLKEGLAEAIQITESGKKYLVNLISIKKKSL